MTDLCQPETHPIVGATCAHNTLFAVRGEGFIHLTCTACGRAFRVDNYAVFFADSLQKR